HEDERGVVARTTVVVALLAPGREKDERDEQDAQRDQQEPEPVDPDGVRDAELGDPRAGLEQLVAPRLRDVELREGRHEEADLDEREAERDLARTPAGRTR